MRIFGGTGKVNYDFLVAAYLVTGVSYEVNTHSGAWLGRVYRVLDNNKIFVFSWESLGTSIVLSVNKDNLDRMSVSLIPPSGIVEALGCFRSKDAGTCFDGNYQVLALTISQFQ